MITIAALSHFLAAEGAGGDRRQCPPPPPSVAKECDGLDGAACFKLARERKGQARTADERAVVRTLYAAACDKSDVSGCLHAGHTHSQPGEYCTRQGYYLKACELGDAQGCERAGSMILKGTPDKTVRGNAARAIPLLKKACDGKWPIACADLAHLYREGIGVRKDLKKAKALDAKAREMGHVEEGAEGEEEPKP